MYPQILLMMVHKKLKSRYMRILKAESKLIPGDLLLILTPIDKELMGEINELETITKSISFIDNDGTVSTFLIENSYTNKLLKLYNSIGINKINVIDITNDILMGGEIKTNYKDLNDEPIESSIKDMFDEFYKDNINEDIIYEKIKRRGSDSLTEFDRIVLLKNA